MSATLPSIDIGTLITSSPEIKGGSPRVKDTGVTVHRIVGWYKLGLSPEAIARKIGHLATRDVYAALTYYHANTEEIEALLAEEEAVHDQLAAQDAVRKTSAR